MEYGGEISFGCGRISYIGRFLKFFVASDIYIIFVIPWTKVGSVYGISY